MADDKREEPRIPVASVVLPFIGSRASDFQAFQYLLQDVSQGGIRIAVPRWAVSRERLHQGERIHFHVPFRLGEAVLEAGHVAWEKWDREHEAQIVGAVLDEEAPANYPVYITLSSHRYTIDLGGFESPGSVFCRALKDSLFLKRGVLIYLKHLSAYFSRTGALEKAEYAVFKEALLDDVIKQVEANEARLKQCGSECLGQDPPTDDAIADLDMDELREAIEPELYLDLFQSALGMGNAKMYLLAIKELEKRLFYNYNTMVMIFIKTLQPPTDIA